MLFTPPPVGIVGAPALWVGEFHFVIHLFDRHLGSDRLLLSVSSPTSAFDTPHHTRLGHGGVGGHLSARVLPALELLDAPGKPDDSLLQLWVDRDR